MAIGLYLLTVTWSLFQHQVWWRGMTTGVLVRASLTCSVYKRALVLSNTSRAIYSNGKLMNHLSTDISRIDYCVRPTRPPAELPWTGALTVSPLTLSRSACGRPVYLPLSLKSRSAPCSSVSRSVRPRLSASEPSFATDQAP